MSNDELPRELNDELLSAYVDGELSPPLRAEVEERLRTDPHAQRLVDDLRAISGAIQSLPREKFAGDLRPRVWAAAEEVASPVAGKIELAPRDRWAGYRRGLAWSAAAIAATLVLMVVQPEGEDRDNREIARVDAKQESAEKAKATSAEGPPEMGAAPATDADVLEAEATPVAAPAPMVDAPAEVAGELAANSDEKMLAGGASASAPFDSAASAPRDQAVSAPPVPAAPKTLATIDATARTPISLARLEFALAEQQIAVSELGAEDSSATESNPLAPGETGLLVEATPAQLVAIYDLLAADREQFADVRVRNDSVRLNDIRGGAVTEGRSFAKAADREVPATRRLNDILAEATSEAQSAADAGGKSMAPGRAWRLQRKDDAAIAKSTLARPALPAVEPPRTLAAESASDAAAQTAPFAATAAAPDVVESKQPASASRRVRVLFVLRAAPSAPPAAQPK